MDMQEPLQRIYCIYYCNRCKFFNLDPQERPADWSLKWKMGHCKANGKRVVMNDPQYDLTPSAPHCDDFVIGKPTKRRESY